VFRREDFAELNAVAPRLEALVLAGDEVDDAVLSTILGACIELRTLWVLNAPNASGSGLCAMSAQLTELRIVSSGITELSQMQSVAKESLEVLYFDGGARSSFALESLQACTNLRQLVVQRTRLHSGGLDALSGLQRLERVTLRFIDLGGEECLRVIGQSIRSRMVEIDGCRVHVAMLDQLGKAGHVTDLVLSDCELTDASLSHDTTQWQLRSLDLTGNGLSDRAVPSLSRIPSLTRLYLGGNRISEQAIARLKRQRPSLEVALVGGMVWEERK
jgi:hypothetical protein